jgi:hypothetical protein
MILGVFLKAPFFPLPYVCPSRLLKSIDKEGPKPAPEKHDYPVTARFPLAGPGKAHLVNPISDACRPGILHFRGFGGFFGRFRLLDEAHFIIFPHPDVIYGADLV